MIISNRRSVGASLGILAVSAMLLTGCSAGQSKAEACTTLNAELESASTELQSSISSLATDPAAAIEALETFEDQFSETVDGISNDEVKELGENTAESLGDYIDAVSDAADDPASVDSEALTGSIEAFQTDAQAIQDACTA